MEPICSFSELAKSSCGEFRKSPYIVRKLLECKDDITGHLQACCLCSLVGQIEEFELILIRAGIFHFSPNQLEKMWICPKHRYNLGRNWRPLRTCQYPLHSGAKKALKNIDVVTLSMSRHVHKIFGITVPIGSGKINLGDVRSSLLSTLMQSGYFNVCDSVVKR